MSKVKYEPIKTNLKSKKYHFWFDRQYGSVTIEIVTKPFEAELYLGGLSKGDLQKIGEMFIAASKAKK